MGARLWKCPSNCRRSILHLLWWSVGLLGEVLKAIKGDHFSMIPHGPFLSIFLSTVGLWTNGWEPLF